MPKSLKMHTEEFSRRKTNLPQPRNDLGQPSGKAVLTGTALERDVDRVKAAVAHGTTLVESRKQRPEDQDYARWCLDVAIHEVTNEIKVAKPASDEKELFELKLESLIAQYAKVTRNVKVSEDEHRKLVAEILADPKNKVNEEWLNASVKFSKHVNLRRSRRAVHK